MGSTDSIRSIAETATPSGERIITTEALLAAVEKQPHVATPVLLETLQADAESLAEFIAQALSGGKHAKVALADARGMARNVLSTVHMLDGIDWSTTEAARLPLAA